MSLSVAIRNSGEPGNTIAAPGDRRGPSSLVMFGYAYEKWIRENAIATNRIKELIRRDILGSAKISKRLE